MNIKLHYLSYFAVVALLFTACKSGTDLDGSESDQDTTINNDTLIITGIDTTDELNKDTTEIVYEDPEVQEAHAEIVKEFGKQWDFCQCILKSDSVNAALMEASDEDFDEVMKRSDFIDSKCKDMLIMPNSTPEDRMKHEQKVKRCKQANKKKG